MNTLFDTSVLIAHLRGDERATELLLTVDGAERMTSVLARIEIEGGMRSAERPAVAALMGVLTLQPVTDNVTRERGSTSGGTGAHTRESTSSTTRSRRRRSCMAPSS